MRAALRIVRTEETAAPVVPWYRRRGVVLTGKVVWWLLTFCSGWRSRSSSWRS